MVYLYMYLLIELCHCCSCLAGGLCGLHGDIVTLCSILTHRDGMSLLNCLAAHAVDVLVFHSSMQREVLTSFLPLAHTSAQTIVGPRARR